MTQESNKQDPKKLVSVEFQTEVNVATREVERRMFLKMYFDARDSGLLADIGDRRWRTLCALATYMDEKGLCYPSQARIAKDLGTTRESVNRRVQELLAYRFQGRPVITVQKARLATAHGGRWANNVYEILPVTGFRIFGDEAYARKTKTPQTESSSPNVTKPSHRPSDSSVIERSHRPMSAEPNTGFRHTNENYLVNETFNVNVLKSLEGSDDEKRTDPQIRALVLDILDVCKDKHSIGSYLRIARTYPEGLIREALSMTKDARARGRIRKSAGAYFTTLIVRLGTVHGIPPTKQTKDAA